MTQLPFHPNFFIFVTLFFLSLASPVLADQNDPRLVRLFNRLKTSEILKNTSSLEIKIWKIWMEHQNPKVQSFMTLGIQALKQRQYSKALEHFSFLIRIEPEFAEGWNKRATVLYLMKRFQESEMDVRRTLELEPRHFGALAGQGLISLAQEDWQGAINALEAGLRIHPQMKSVLNNLKYALRKHRESLT